MLLQLPQDILGPILRLKLGEYSMSIATLRQTCRQMRDACLDFPKFIDADRLDGCSLQTIQSTLSSPIIAEELDGWHWRGLYHNAVMTMFEDDMIYLVKIYNHNFLFLRCSSRNRNCLSMHVLGDLTLLLDKMSREKALHFLEKILPCPCVREQIAEACLATNKLWLYETLPTALEVSKSCPTFGLSVVRSKCSEALNMSWFDASNKFKNGRLYIAALRAGNLVIANAIDILTDIPVCDRFEACAAAIGQNHHSAALYALNTISSNVDSAQVIKLFERVTYCGSQTGFLNVFNKFQTHVWVRNCTSLDVLASLANSIFSYAVVYARAILMSQEDFLFFYRVLSKRPFVSADPDVRGKYGVSESCWKEIAYYLLTFSSYNVPQHALKTLLQHVEIDCHAESTLHYMLLMLVDRSSNMQNIRDVLDCQCLLASKRQGSSCLPETKIEELLLACSSTEAFELIKSHFASEAPRDISEALSFLVQGRAPVNYKNWLSCGGDPSAVLHNSALVENHSEEILQIGMSMEVLNVSESYVQEIALVLLRKSRLKSLKNLFSNGFSPNSITLKAMFDYIKNESEKFKKLCDHQTVAAKKNESRMLSWLRRQLLQEATGYENISC